MTKKAHPEDDAPNATFHHTENSPTAATVGNKLFGESGPMIYRVTVQGGMGLASADFKAATGDDAASAALAKFPGAKVAHVAPAPQELQDA